MLYTKQQLESARQALPLVAEANRLLVQAHLPAGGAGVQEATSGLSDALAGLKMILEHDRRDD